MNKKAPRRPPLKEPPLRLPGEGLDDRLKDLAFDKPIPLLLATSFSAGLLGGVGIQWLFGRHLPFWLLALASAVLTVYTWVAILRFVRQAKNIRLGRSGERHVGQLLQSLEFPGIRVFHDIPTGDANLDHVVVCDRGIYVIETKTWSKPANAQLVVRGSQILINGSPASGNALGQAAAGARWLSEKLHAETGHPHRCQAVVALPGWFVDSQDAESKRLAWVLEPKALPGWIRRDPVQLDESAIRRIETVIAKHVRGYVQTAEEARDR